ncbi:MAG: bifunctional glycosyltransferase family 2/GtrA family protein [Eubacteriales bacterium]|nr:bifunctional glycosyltransferase family 2/GtrA family protein [Clostridiales bacterium]MDY2769038.1 bifunctional glycosyltransferase family 2/GtrA family protein [Eubacteriales bacterium]
MNAILIPAYKPDDKLVALTDQLLTHDDLKLVVVDDGSGEAFRPVFEALDKRVTLISYPDNKGKGGALKTGIRYIMDHMPECERLVTADADGQHRYADIRRVLDKSEEMPGALVLGSRAFDGDVPLRSRFGNAMTRQVFAIASGVKVRDTQTGLRGFDRDGMRLFVDVPGDRYEYEINMLLTAARAEMPIYEVTIETVYLNDNESSHFNPLKDSLRIYACILKFACSSLICFGIDYVLFQLLRTFIPLTWVSNLLARIVSASVNFTLNKKLVFKGNEKTLPAVLKYAALAVFIYLIDTAILALLYEKLGWSRYVVKIISGLLGYLISFSVQGRIVYRKQKH